MMIYSIVRITSPGALCSYPVGRFEVYHSDDESTAVSACETFNRCRFADNLGFEYRVEHVDELSDDRAPEKAPRDDAICVPNCRFI